MRNNIATPIEHRFVTLMVSYNEVLKRVSGDLSRGMSRDPQFLKRLHQQFVAALGFLRDSSMVVEADHRTPSELAESIRGAMLSEPATSMRETI